MKKDKNIGEDYQINFVSLVKSEYKKLISPSSTVTILFTILFLTIIMIGVSIYQFKNNQVWNAPFSSIVNPVNTLLAIPFILLVCEEWSVGTGITTYALVPQRTKVVLAKLCVLLSLFVIVIISLLFLTIGTSLAGLVFHSYSISWNTSWSQLISSINSLFVNLMLGFSLALLLRDNSTAIVLYFLIPPITVILPQLPVIGQYARWISLGHSSSLFVGGVIKSSVAQYICSLFIWIILPMVAGIIQNRKLDFN